MLYRFSVFEFESDPADLRKNGRVVALEPQPAKALALLLARAGEVVAREDLRDAVWGGGTYVDFDRGLAYCLSQIRSALGDSGDNPRFVQTLPKKGYKFIAPVSGKCGYGNGPRDHFIVDVQNDRLGIDRPGGPARGSRSPARKARPRT